MPEEQWLRQKFIYYYFCEKGITPEQVDNMMKEDVDVMLLINHYQSEKQEREAKKQQSKWQKHR